MHCSLCKTFFKLPTAICENNHKLCKKCKQDLTQCPQCNALFQNRCNTISECSESEAEDAGSSNTVSSEWDLDEIFAGITSELKKTNQAIDFAEENFKGLELLKKELHERLEKQREMVENNEKVMLYLTEKSGLMEEYLAMVPPQDSFIVPQELHKTFRDNMKLLGSFIQTPSISEVLQDLPKKIESKQQFIDILHDNILRDHEAVQSLTSQVDNLVLLTKDQHSEQDSVKEP
ncbi:uncharacterized protein [Anabrus simplex]